MTLPAWFVMVGAIAGIALLAFLIFRNHRGRHSAEHELADDVEAWLRARETAM